MKNELDRLMRTAGVATEWETPANYTAVNGYLVIVDLDGDCNAPAPPGTQPLPGGVHLGSSATTDGRILPFVNVHCDALGTLLAPVMVDKSASARAHVLGRSIGRVLAHELYHILTQSEDHPDTGLAKPRFSAADLVKNRFEFDDVALARIQASQSVESDPAAFDSGGGSGGEVAVDSK